MLGGLDPSSAHYAAIVNAINYLQSVIDSGAPGQDEIIGAMGMLTQAMAGIY